MDSWRSLGIGTAFVMLWLGFSSGKADAAQVSPASANQVLRQLEQAAGGPVDIKWSSANGSATFITTGTRTAVSVQKDAAAPPADRARAFLRAYGQALGLPGANDVAVLKSQGPDDVGMEHVRLQQTYKGIAVRFGELTVHLRGAGIVAVHAKTVGDLDAVDVTPHVTAAAALSTATELVRAQYGTADAAFSLPRLELFNHGLLDGKAAATRLAWFTEGQGPGLRLLVWVDAQSGQVLLHVNQVPDALVRRVYDMMNTPSPLPGTPARFEGQGPTGNVDVDSAYDYTADTYNYFLTEHGRDSFNNAGATMRATVRYCDSGCGCPCLNSFWNGSQTLFGANLAVDDVVGHEWTHGVTQYTADLIYYAASGAMNESFSDIFGETIDLTNGAGYDPPAARWRFGEASYLPNGIRNMMDPRVGYESGPGKMSDPEFWCKNADGVGVHHNSGIGNHAYALLVDGGTYNGYTISGIGLTKGGKIEYRALAHYLTSGSGYQDDYAALQQACADLIGTAGITSADCVEVKKALDAVEMGSPWPCDCGNGVLDPGEQCDDGNRIDGDCCSAACLLEPAGSPCTDSNVCTNDQCDGAGHCQSTNNTSPCDDGNTCTTGDTCTGGSCVGATVPACLWSIPGGGSTATDCGHEWLVVAPSVADRNGLPAHRVACTDNDPRCDYGTVSGDAACTFRIGMCFNVTDSRLACVPSDTPVVRLSRPGPAPRSVRDAANRNALEAALIPLGGSIQGTCTNRGPNRHHACTANDDCDSSPGQGDGVCPRSVVFQPPLAGANSCTAMTEVTVPLRSGRRGTKVLKLQVKDQNTAGAHVRDSDTLTLVCNPI